MHAVKRLALALAMSAVAVPAAAQVGGYDGEMFVKAVREGNGSEALKLMQSTPTLVNARDLNGNTALVAAIENRDETWTGYLLREGADPDLPTSSGETPLMAAAKIGFTQAVEWLLGMGAKVDEENKMGETALIVAVQRRQIPVVRALIAAGANPDKPDAAAGYSARDYAKRDNRTPELLRIIEAKKPKP